MLRSLVLSAIAAGSLLMASPADAAVQVNPIKNLSADFIKGADVSMLPELESLGGKFYDMDGTEMDELALMKKYGSTGFACASGMILTTKMAAVIPRPSGRSI